MQHTACARSVATREPIPAAGHCWSMPPQETLKHWKAGVALWGLWVLVHARFFEPFEHLWLVCSLTLNMILPLLPSCWGLSFAFGDGVAFLVGLNILLSMVSVCFQGKPLNIKVIQVYTPTTNAKEAEVEWLDDDLQDLLELTPKKRCPFHHRGLECKTRKTGDTGSNRSSSTKWSRTNANRVLARKCSGHGKHPLPTTQEKTLHMDINRWTIPKSDWLYYLQPKMEKLYIVSKNKT